MIKNILVYRQNMDTGPDLAACLNSMGRHCVEFEDGFEDWHTDAAFVMKAMHYVEEEDIHMVLSWDYLPLLASVCEMKGLPYVSWICHCPQDALRSKTILYHCNYFLCFDRVYANRLTELGCENVYHFPLAVDVKAEKEDPVRYTADISFAGGLNGEQDGRFIAEGISEYIKGYISGIEEAQIRVYGYNFVRDMIDDETAKSILDKNGIVTGDMYFDNPVQYAADLINQDITEKERARVAERLSRSYELCDTADYRNCKINLNITPKGVESGIPRRVLDILAGGGFCLTNYQPEIAEFFEDGSELVMYTDMEDLVRKTDYYLQHEEEGKAIAGAGYEKVMAQFSLQERMEELLHIAEDCME